MFNIDFLNGDKVEIIEDDNTKNKEFSILFIDSDQNTVVHKDKLKL